jgi:hypothetical protein
MEGEMPDDVTRRSLDYISSCTDASKLRQVASNAHAQGNAIVREAARRKLYEVLPSEAPGTVEYDVWQSIYALEDTLTQERGKTTRLSRTRQKIKRDKEIQTVADLVLRRPSEGFYMLVERNLPELTFEAVALRHPGKFEQPVLKAAAARLREIGYD